MTRRSHEGLFPPAGGRGRFDAPDRSFRVLHTAIDRPAAFAETLQLFRPSLEVRAALAQLRFGEVTQPIVPLRTWAAERVLLRLRLPAAVSLLDLRQADAIERIATECAAELRALDLEDFDSSHLLGSDRRVTQVVAKWAYDNHFDGLLAPSRFAANWTICAVFDRVRPRIIARESIDPADPDLTEVALMFHLRVSG